MHPEKKFSELSGKRRQVDQIGAIRYPHPWPLNASRRDAEFRSWRDFAMQILHHNGISFRTISVIRDLLDPDTGDIWASDEDIAHMAGRCGTKTISREIQSMKQVGVLIANTGYREKNGKLVRTRTMWLALPIKMPDYVHTEEIR